MSIFERIQSHEPSEVEESHDGYLCCVIDNGSACIKAGFGGDDKPAIEMPCLKALTKSTGYTFVGCNCSNCCPPNFAVYGEDAVHAHSYSKYPKTSPLEMGVVQDWDGMEGMWNHLIGYHVGRLDCPMEFEECDEYECSQVLLLENMQVPLEQTAKTMELMFDNHYSDGCEKVLIGQQQVFSLYAQGRVNGVVLDVGHGGTFATAVFEGHALDGANCSMEFGGSHFEKELKKCCHDLRVCYNMFFTRQMKEEMGFFVAQDAHHYAELLEDFDGRESYTPPSRYSKYELPDGETISLGQELFTLPEMFFTNESSSCSRISYENFYNDRYGKYKWNRINNKIHSSGGVHHMVAHCINQCAPEFRKTLMDNIVLTGGCSLFEGFESRLRNELIDLFPETCRSYQNKLWDGHMEFMTGIFEDANIVDEIDRMANIKHSSLEVCAPEGETRKHMAWIGGSIFSQVSTAQELFIEREEYDEYGPEILRRKGLRL